MTQSQNQKGFGVIGIAVVGLVVVALAVTGFMVFRHNNKATVQSSTTPSTSDSITKTDTATTQPAQTAQQYLVIKEWGVSLTLDGTTESLYYYISPGTPDVAYLSLKTISDIAPKCAADKSSLAAIGRLTETEQDNATKNPSSINQPGTIHIGNYWYSFGTSKAQCIENSDQGNAVEKAQQPYDLKTVFDSLKAAS